MKEYVKKAIPIFIMLLVAFPYIKRADTQIETDQMIIQDSIEERKNLQQVVESQKEKIKELEKSFTYLDELTEEEYAAYKTFYETKDSADLNLSAEKTLLVYLHAASNGDIETLHALTYKAPSLDEFSDEYYTGGQVEADLDAVLLYRYYDYAKILEGDEADTDAIIEIAVSQSSTKSANVYGLKKDGNSWKLDFPSVEEG